MALRLTDSSPQRRHGRVSRRFLFSRLGATQVEFALFLPLLALLVVAVIDFGSAMTRKMQLANAVRAGTQYAMVRKPIQGDVSQIENAVTATAPLDANGTQQVEATIFCECLDGTPVACDGLCADGTDERNSFVRITLGERHDFILPYPGLGASVDLFENVTVQLN